jgi:hypothetical protein
MSLFEFLALGAFFRLSDFVSLKARGCLISFPGRLSGEVGGTQTTPMRDSCMRLIFKYLFLILQLVPSFEFSILIA